MTVHPVTFTDRSNAIRAARKLVAGGSAPAQSFEVRKGQDGRHEILWLTGEPPAFDNVAAEIAAAETAAVEPQAAAARSPRKARKTDALPPAAPHFPRQRKTRAAAERPQTGPRAKFAGAPVEPGAMPEKPVLTAAGFTASYQKRIDQLAEFAAAGDWAAVEAFEVKGKNTYSKIVARYRAQLVAANAAQQGAGQ